MDKGCKLTTTTHKFYDNKNPANTEFAGFYIIFDVNQVLLVAQLQFYPPVLSSFGFRLPLV